MDEKMDEQKQTPAANSAPVVGGGRQRSGKALAWALAVLLVLALAAGGFLGWQLMAAKDKEQQLNQEKQQLQQQIDELKQAEGTEETANAAGSGNMETCNDTPSGELKANIKAALDSKNTAAFATYVSDPVMYVLAASEYGGNVSPDEAATSLEYTHSATGPWDFELPEATVDGYDAGFYTDYFDENTYVGKAASGMVVAFDFNCDGKISQIFVAADESIL